MRILREFLYVDVPKVRGLLAQLDEGIAESTVTGESTQKTTGGGLKGVVGHQVEWGETNQVNKTLGDALFPILEEAMETEGLLADISEELTNSEFWESGDLRDQYPAGSLVRISAEGHLFDSRFVGRSITNFAATSIGLQNLDAVDAGPSETMPPVPPKAKRGGSGQKGPKPPRKAVPADWAVRPIEAEIPGDFSALDGELTGRSLHGVILVSRGVYSPGLYLNLHPCVGEKSYVVSARLEEGRSFLDSEPDVLFARYGVGQQEWTIVGVVGHHGLPRVEPDFSSGNFIDSDGNVVRAAFSEFVNSFVQFLGGLGFVDLVQAPAFSVVPIAVYRVLNPRSAGVGAVESA